MNKVKIKFNSVTHALRAKELIQENGGKAIITRTSDSSKNTGCGYVVVATGDTEKLINLIKINKIKYMGYVFL